MVILALDTATNAAAAGIISDGALLCEHTLNNGKTHSVNLLPMLDVMLKETGITYKDIDVFACGVGPGSFTGIRIGAATVKAFGQSLSKKLLPLSSLQILAENIKSYQGARVAVMYARADELFCAAYGALDEEIIAPCVFTVEELAARLKGTDCRLVGDGALRFREELESALGSGTVASEESAHTICGGALAQLAYRFAKEENLVSYEELAPVYLRVSQAEREYKEKGEKQ